MCVKDKQVPVSKFRGMLCSWQLNMLVYHNIRHVAPIMDAFHRPLDQVQPVSEISNMKQMQWWRRRSGCQSMEIQLRPFSYFIYRFRKLYLEGPGFRETSFESFQGRVWVNAQKSCEIQK